MRLPLIQAEPGDVLDTPHGPALVTDLRDRYDGKALVVYLTSGHAEWARLSQMVTVLKDTPQKVT